MSSRRNGQLVLSARTPMSMTNGRQKIDAQITVTNGFVSGRKKIDGKASEVHSYHKLGKAHVDPTVCPAVAAHNGSSDIQDWKPSNRGRRHVYVSNTITMLGNLPEQHPKPCGKNVHPQKNRSSEKLAAPISERNFGISETVAEQSKMFHDIITPKCRNFTFQPHEVVDNRDREIRLLASGAARKERRHVAPMNQCSVDAVTPPWIAA